MAKTSLLDTSTVSINDIFSNGKVYRVPPYQRDYSWREEHLEDLWHDIVELESNALPHYMGAIVLQPSSGGLIIIDGQQRLATFSVFVLAVLKKISDLAEAGHETEQNRERHDLLFKQYIGAKDPASLRSSSKLFLNENDDGFYQQNLIQFRTPLNARKLSESERRLWEAHQYFLRSITQHFEGRMTGGGLAAFLNEVVGTRLMFIQIQVQDDLSAYTVFETLNARGMELTATDLLKNYLFSKVAPSHVDLRHVREQWRNISQLVGMDDFPDFLRHFMNSRQAYVRRERLFKAVKLKVDARDKVFGLLDELQKAAYWYKALGDPQDDFWADYPGCEQEVRILNLFNVTQYKPLILACAGRFQSGDLCQVLRACVVVSFRFNMIGRRNTHALEDIYNQAAVAVHGGASPSLRQVLAGLRPIYIPDDEFQNDFQAISLSTRSKKKLVSYILCSLERHLSGTDLDFETAEATIEHILPENPQQGWDEFSEEDRERMTYRLGNMTLLEKNMNKSAANRSFADKVALYQKSQYRMTKEIQSGAWVPEAVNKRQSQMAKWATSIWRLTF